MSSVTDTPELERSSLRDQVRSILRAKIITGELEEGTLYSVGEFATRLGVSATPVREALGDLEQHGLVQVIRNRCFVVPTLTDHDLDEIFQLRIMLEVPTVERVIGKLTVDELATCDAIVQRCLACAREGDLTGFLEADRDFHLRLLGALGNRRLVDIVDRLRDQTRLYGLLMLAPDNLVASAQEHEDLLQAIAAKDERRARERLVHHLEHTRGLWAGRPVPET